MIPVNFKIPLARGDEAFFTMNERVRTLTIESLGSTFDIPMPEDSITRLGVGEGDATIFMKGIFLTWRHGTIPPAALGWPKDSWSGWKYDWARLFIGESKREHRDGLFIEPDLCLTPEHAGFIAALSWKLGNQERPFEVSGCSIRSMNGEVEIDNPCNHSLMYAAFNMEAYRKMLSGEMSQVVCSRHGSAVIRGSKWGIPYITHGNAGAPSWNMPPRAAGAILAMLMMDSTPTDGVNKRRK